MSNPVILPEDLERLGVDAEQFAIEAKKELERRKKADFYLNHPWLFLKNVCTAPEHRFYLNEDLHGGGLKFINTPDRRKLILWPRGHLKSTTFTMGEALRRAVKDPNIRILISSAKWDNAKSFLAGIKGILREPRFIELYGNLLPPPNDKFFKNNDAMLSLTTKTKDFKQATFSTTGLDAEKTSQHYDLIIHDDVVARDNVSNPLQMEKVIQYYRDCVSLLDPKREMWIIGTRWHPLDLYGWLMDGATDQRCRENGYTTHVPNCNCRITVSIRQLIEDGKYIFPQKFDDEVMRDLVESDQLDRYSLACQYYNNPADPSTCWFRSQDIDSCLIDADYVRTKLDDKGHKKERQLVWYCAVDPAESTSSRACLSAAVAVGIDQEDGTWYVDWAEGRRVETPGFLDLCMDTYRRYTPAKFGMELHTKRSLEYSLKRRQLDDQMVFHIEELKPQKVGDATRTKEERIKRLLPLFESKKIKINRNCKALLDELYTIPASTSRDLTDALSYILDLVPPGMGARKQDIRLPRRYTHFKAAGY